MSSYCCKIKYNKSFFKKVCVYRSALFYSLSLSLSSKQPYEGRLCCIIVYVLREFQANYCVDNFEKD